jgi:hypothetical protein
MPCLIDTNILIYALAQNADAAVLSRKAKPDLTGGLPGAWGGAASAPFTGRCPLPDRGATHADGIARLSFIDSCSRLFHGGYRSQWHIKTGFATTPLAAWPLWPGPWPARRGRCIPVTARPTLQDALHRIRSANAATVGAKPWSVPYFYEQVWVEYASLTSIKTIPA